MRRTGRIASLIHWFPMVLVEDAESGEILRVETKERLARGTAVSFELAKDDLGGEVAVDLAETWKAEKAAS